MASSPAYLWYPNDALSSGRIEELSAAEECWYRRALDRSWMDGGVPSDPARLARRIGKKCTEKAAAMILEMFFEPHKKDTSKMVNPRQESERKKFQQKSKKNSDAGKASGRKRREIRDLNAEQTLNQTRTKTNISSSISFPISFPISSLDLKRLIDWAAAENSKKDSRLVEVAILETLMNRNGSTEPINSLQYFAPQIKQITSKGSGIPATAIDALLKRRREQMAEFMKLRAVA